MVSVLAERAADDPQERARVSQITSALLTWSVLILVPLTLVVAAASGRSRSCSLAFGLVAYLLNDGDLRAAAARLRQVTRTRS